MLQGKKIILGVTGSIAAYKSLVLLRLLIKSGAEVRVIMTPSAINFINPLSFSTLSKSPVLIDLAQGDVWANHVDIGRNADLMIIAPASCNTLAKMAHGLCDNLLLAIYLSATCPVLVVPAMDEDMWKHPSTRRNVQALKEHQNQVMSVNSGELASGLIGEGRMAEPEEIMAYVTQFLKPNQTLKNKKALVTAGPTYESLDPVRFLGNHSSGKMGLALAKELQSRGAEVTLVAGPVSIELPSGMNVLKVTSASEMYEAVMDNISGMDYIIMAAAVADYTPVNKSNEKIKKTEKNLILELEKTKDILKEVGKIRTDRQVLVGFALETENEIENAQKKLKSKHLDFIVLNSLKDKGAGFSHDTNKITIFDKLGNHQEFPLKSKRALAFDIINAITHLDND